MIGVKLQGGLGNQLFQYAFAISTVRKLKTFYVIDDLRNPDRFLKYFRRMSLTDFAFIRTALLKYFRRSKPKTLKQSSSDANHLFLLKMANHIYYEGFFQSVDFFKDVSGLLKDKIRLRSEYRKQFDEKYGQLFRTQKVLAIHCRLGDYLVWGSDERGGINASLPNSYYCNALSLIPDLEDYSIIVVTDDVKNMESHYPILKDKMIVSEDEIVDFQILMNAQVVITANSSFSWWAAYLNTNVRKIFAPKCWLGFKVNKEIPWGVIPPEFVPVDTF